MERLVTKRMIVDWLTGYKDRMIVERLLDWLPKLIVCREINCLADCMVIDWLIAWCLIDWLQRDWLLDWLSDDPLITETLADWTILEQQIARDWLQRDWLADCREIDYWTDCWMIQSLQRHWLAEWFWRDWWTNCKRLINWLWKCSLTGWQNDLAEWLRDWLFTERLIVWLLVERFQKVWVVCFGWTIAVRLSNRLSDCWWTGCSETDWLIVPVINCKEIDWLIAGREETFAVGAECW